MRGCPLPLTKLALPSHLCNGINFFPLPIAATHHCHSLTIHTPKASTLLSTQQQPKANADTTSSASTSVPAHQQQQQDNDEEESFQVLTALKSHYNDILIVDTPKSRMLLLDSSHNVHSILYKEQKWTGSYWDEFASLPAIVPKGPIAILGWWNCCSSDA